MIARSSHSDARAKGVAAHVAMLQGATPEGAVALAEVTFGSKSNCKRAALKALGEDAVHGVDFNMTNIDGRWTWAQVVSKPSAGAAAAKTIAAVDDKLVVAGIRYPNLARADDARRRSEQMQVAKVKAAKPSKSAAPAVRGQAASTAALEAAQRGELPAPPVFTAPTSLPYQKRLDPLLAAIEAGDIAALKASNVAADCKDSRVAAMGKFRDLAIVALLPRAAKNA